MNNTQYVSPKESAYCPKCKTHPQQIRTRNHAERFCSDGHTFTLKQSREAERKATMRTNKCKSCGNSEVWHAAGGPCEAPDFPIVDTYGQEKGKATMSNNDAPPRHPLDTLSFPDLVALRGIIGEVIADGPWEFFAGTDDTCGPYEREQRQVFIIKCIDRVIAAAAPNVKGVTTHATSD